MKLSFDLVSCRLGTAIYSIDDETVIARSHVPRTKLVTPSAVLETTSVLESQFRILPPSESWYKTPHYNIGMDPAFLSIPSRCSTLAIWSIFYARRGTDDGYVQDLYMTITPPCSASRNEQEEEE